MMNDPRYPSGNLSIREEGNKKRPKLYKGYLSGRRNWNEFFFSSFHFLFLVFLRSTCRSRELENGTPPRVRDLRGWWRTRSFKGLADDVKRAERGSALSSRFRGSKRASFFFFFFFVLPFPAKHDQSLFPPFQQFVNDDDSPLVPRP